MKLFPAFLCFFLFVLGGGTIWLHLAGTSQVRCVVISLPLGISRHGVQRRGGCFPA